MHSNRIKLVKPDLELIPQVRAAVLESRAELEKYLGWVQNSLDNPESNMQLAITNHEMQANELRYYIFQCQPALLVGTIGLIVRDRAVPFFEIGYWVRTSQTGRGFVTEAVGLLESYAFLELHANRLEIRMAKCNLRSRAVAENSGYQLEAELLNERRLPSGALSNTLVYAKCDLGI